MGERIQDDEWGRSCRRAEKNVCRSTRANEKWYLINTKTWRGVVGIYWSPLHILIEFSRASVILGKTKKKKEQKRKNPKPWFYNEITFLLPCVLFLLWDFLVYDLLVLLEGFTSIMRKSGIVEWMKKTINLGVTVGPMWWISLQ